MVLIWNWYIRSSASSMQAICIVGRHRWTVVVLSQKYRPSNLSERHRKTSNVGKDAIPKMRRYYHIEYFLLPDDLEPRKLDLALFGVVAKLFVECESKVVKPWFENDQIWVSWNHSIDVNVTNEFLIKLRDHKVTLKIWDTKDKVSTKARFSKPRLPYSQAEDSDAIGKLFLPRQSSSKTIKRFDNQPPPLPGSQSQEEEEEEISYSFSPPHDTSSVTEEIITPSTSSSSSDEVKQFQELFRRAVESMAIPIQETNESHHKLLNILQSRSSTRMSLPMDKALLEPAEQIWQTPASIPSTNRKVERRYHIPARESAYLFSHPPPNSLVMEAAKKLVISRLQEKSPKILDAYLTFTTEEHLISEKQKRDLNPLIIKIHSATCLPTTPVPIEVLQATCVPTYCRYQFHHFPPHQTQGQTHGTHIYFKDVNVILTGTISPGELREYFRGPPLEIEVHDRDRKMAEDVKKPSLFGDEQDDGKLSNVGLVSCKQTVHNPFTEKDNLWHPYGIAKVNLTDLLLGEKYLNITVPIHSCSVPDPTDYQKDDKNEKIMGVLGSVDGLQTSPLPMGHYLESDSVLKVRVEIAVPLGLQAETTDTEVADCPYGCIVYIFDYNNAPCLQDLLQEITEINAKALQLDSYPLHIIQKSLATFKLKTKTKEISELDIITGFHILDGTIHLLVLEGLKDKAIKRLWERTHRSKPGRLDILYNSQLSFHQRLYIDLEAILYHIHLCKPLSAITRQPLLYVRDMVPEACFQALSRLDYLCHSKKLRDVIQRSLLPSAEMITVLSQEFGIPLTKEDLFIQKPPPRSFSPFALQKSRKVTIKQGAMHSLLDNYNEKYVWWKKEVEDKMQHYKDHIQTNIDAMYLLSRKVKKPKVRAIRSSPADSKSVYNYSSQKLNSAEHAKMQLRKELAKRPERRFTYCHEYLSATFDPVDLDTIRKESIAKSKNMWVSPSGFVCPGYKSSIESNLSGSMHIPPICLNGFKWQENILFANILEPVLSRDRWSWNQRHVDFDLYKKPPDYLPASAPATHQAGNWSIFNLTTLIFFNLSCNTHVWGVFAIVLVLKLCLSTMCVLVTSTLIDNRVLWLF
uniref:Cilia and flagella associated protein 92 (putative) n=1 Tax=Pelusios castaneus TaxID=367368 RepID=A0A8C8SH48_9SAUR